MPVDQQRWPGIAPAAIGRPSVRGDPIGISGAARPSASGIGLGYVTFGRTTPGRCGVAPAAPARQAQAVARGDIALVGHAQRENHCAPPRRSDPCSKLNWIFFETRTSPIPGAAAAANCLRSKAKPSRTSMHRRVLGDERTTDMTKTPSRMLPVTPYFLPTWIAPRMPAS